MATHVHFLEELVVEDSHLASMSSGLKSKMSSFRLEGGREGCKKMTNYGYMLFL